MSVASQSRRKRTAAVPAPEPWSASWVAQVRRRLLAWFARHGRPLPWRQTRDPYAIWLSEAMLQQTQVATVIPYYERFLAALPTVAHLAAAPEQEVLRLWEGLGYYRRARQLHRAAGVLVREHAGEFPRTVEALRALPGIGRYTAGAILSFAFDLPAPILETNTQRVLCRLLAYEGDPRRAAAQQLLWQSAERLVPARQAGALNQALMELGSQVCLPRNWRCDECPLATLCPTQARGLQARIPQPPAKPRVEAVREAAVVVRRRGRVLLVQRGEGERWAGLWDFPRFPLTATQPAELRRQLAAGVRAQAGVEIEPGAPLATIKHTVTRFRITLECYAASYAAAGGQSSSRAVRWAAPTELAALPLTTPARRLSRVIEAESPPPAGRRPRKAQPSAGRSR